MALLKVMGVHGLGDHRTDPWAINWERELRRSFPTDAHLDIQFVAFNYDDIFEKITPTASESLMAFLKLTGSGIVNGIGGLFGRRSLPSRGLDASVNQWLKWYAGYVVAWVENAAFRAEVRQKFLALLDKEKPDILAAHSLGSLITYDALCDPGSLPDEVQKHLKKLVYITLGSQINNAFVVGNLTHGRVVPLTAKHWYHLYNTEDDVFTAAIALPGEPNFSQVETFFDIEGFADHDALEYLHHRATIRNVWEPLRNEAIAAEVAEPGLATAARGMRAPSVSSTRKPRKRALLVGINDYPDPANRLAGCVNDVFLVSSVLQECGFTPDDIRVVLNDRATATGILDRMRWLLEDAAPKDDLVFFYSGHGAQLPTYGDGDTVDRMDETLVPWDFDWSPERSITDDQIYRWYSQLPYDTHFVMVFDCCHSGGIHRDGAPRARGITPPDDIRHRALYWNPATEMWLPRALPPIQKGFTDDPAARQQYFGAKGSLSRLGRAAGLRRDTAAEYEAAKQKSKGKVVGPYLPVILEACQEEQLAFEYRHGVESFGAFTYSLASILRKSGSVSFRQLVAKTKDRLEALGYNQTPTVLGPKKIVQAKIPWAKSS